MNIIIRTVGQVKLTDAVKDHINVQIKSLEKKFNSSEKVNVNVLCIEKNGKYKSEITIVLKHIVLRAECNGDTLYASINQAVDKIDQQLIRHNRKVNAIIKKREGISSYFVEQLEEKPEEKNELVKTKKIDLIEMSVDEAITEMEMVDHEFFMFKNEENHCVAVVYKRNNGGYGLIESIE